MTAYQKIDAMEIENRLRAHLDELVRLAGGRLTVFRIARIVFDDMRAQQAAEERANRKQVEEIMGAVTAAHNQPFECLRAQDRTHRVAWCRHHAIWEVRQRRSDLSLTKIAAWFDREDHTTILNSIRKFNNAIKEGQYVGERTLVERALSC